jgi:hypothetical protein
MGAGASSGSRSLTGERGVSFRYWRVRSHQSPQPSDGSMDIDTKAGSGIPPTSNETSPQHFGFIRSVNERPDGSCELQIYPVVSFARNGGALAGYNHL